MRGMGRDLSDHHVVLSKVRLVGSWIKRKKLAVGDRRIRSEKLREDRYRGGYTRSLERKRIEGDDNNVEHMWEQVKRTMVERARKVCGSVRVEGKTQRLCAGTMR